MRASAPHAFSDTSVQTRILAKGANNDERLRELRACNLFEAAHIILSLAGRSAKRKSAASKGHLQYSDRHEKLSRFAQSSVRLCGRSQATMLRVTQYQDQKAQGLQLRKPAKSIREMAASATELQLEEHFEHIPVSKVVAIFNKHSTLLSATTLHEQVER